MLVGVGLTGLAATVYANTVTYPAGAYIGVAAVLAVATWGFFRGLGWVVAGFARD